MVDQLRSFAAEVTRVAREVGTEGKLGGQADVQGVAGTWKDLTDSVNSMAGNLTAQVRNIADVTKAVAAGDLSKKITVDVKGEILELKNTDQHDGRPAQLVRRRSDPRRPRGRHRRQARRPGPVQGVAGTWKDLTDSRQLHGRQPHRAGARHRQGRDRGRQRRSEAEAHRRSEGRDRGARRYDQQHDRHARDLRRSGDDAWRARWASRASSAARRRCRARPGPGRTSPTTSISSRRTSPRRCVPSPTSRPP